VSLPIIDDANAVPADKLQEGTPSDCNRWIVANNTQAACWKLANDAKISMQRLFELNPVLGTTGANCASQVWLGYYYCIATPGDGTSPSPTKPITSATPTTGPAKPTQTQSGIDPNCNSFAQAPALTWPIFTNGTLVLDQTERIATHRSGPSIITAWESRPQRRKLLPQRPKLPPLLQVLRSLPEHRLGFLPTVRNGWRPKMEIPAGLSAMQMASI
jgi:hypothetical protein